MQRFWSSYEVVVQVHLLLRHQTIPIFIPFTIQLIVNRGYITRRHRRHWDIDETRHTHTHSFFRCLSRLSHAHSGNRSLGIISMLNDVCAAFQLASTLIGLIVDEFLLNMYMRFAAGLDAVCLVSRAKLCVCNGRRSFFFACILMQSLRLHIYHHCLLLYAIVIIIVCLSS